MIAFEVQDMTCGHCVASITKALQAADPLAVVEIDLGRHRVQVEPGRADAAALRVAMEDAGFTPVVLAG
ncbi:MAG: heavy-metal-associated domain-containing protein [Burkholderiales bacterium]|nr:heavy-metal-associated domain-containing protein [Burkholderiales bacterium]MDE1926733.1 heavy-metal-associated domain-containing protein [Burkholderiales bacterium]MDE2160798.1 heavy-metal-associated domain-containing protein [Burkholderiales bacterium]MDE2504105.1 heavy-metal-associated domain-containing protein [Burkholderiales bacterium]